jgi:ribosome biogenesis GTPase A
MKKTIRLIGESISLVDLVLYVLDARIPSSSRNGELERAVKRKTCLFLLNKSDLADAQATSQWIEVLAGEEFRALALSSKTGAGFRELKEAIESQRQSLCRKRREKGRLDEQIRLMVIGIPNVGKSTVINRLTGRSVARSGKRPGVTKGIQWISVSKKVELMDMPGVFYPNVENEESAWHLASVGTVKEEILPLEEVAMKILEFLREKGHVLADKSLTIDQNLEEIGRSMSFFDKKDHVDLRRTSLHLLKGFREGNFGRYTLETSKLIIR